MRELVNKNLCERLIEELLIEITATVPFIVPYTVGAIKRGALTERNKQKTVYEAEIVQHTVKGTATVMLVTPFITIDDGHRVEIDVRLDERKGAGRLRLRGYKGTRVLKTQYITISKYDLARLNSTGQLLKGVFRKSAYLEVVLTSFVK